jgi:hypothetical protein
MGGRSGMERGPGEEERVDLPMTIFISFGRNLVPISGGAHTILIDIYRGFLLSLQVNVEVVPRLGHGHFLPISILSLFIVTFHTILFSY